MVTILLGKQSSTQGVQPFPFSQRDPHIPKKIGILGPYSPDNMGTRVPREYGDPGPYPPRKRGPRVLIFTWHRKGYSPEDQYSFEHISKTNSNLLCHNCPTHLSHEPFLYPHYVLLHTSCVYKFFTWWTLMCQLVLVLPHLTHNLYEHSFYSNKTS